MGKVTNEVFARYAGNTLLLRGSYGNGFELEDYQGKDLIVMAGGTGLSPVRGVVDYFSRHPAQRGHMTLIAGFKTPHDILFRDDLKRWALKDVSLPPMAEVKTPLYWKGIAY